MKKLLPVFAVLLLSACLPKKSAKAKSDETAVKTMEVEAPKELAHEAAAPKELAQDTV